MRRLLWVLSLLAAPAWACEGLQVSDAWIRETPPGAMVAAGYATIKNGGSRPLTISSASSAAFGATELHRSVEENGQFRMLVDQQPVLAPGASLRFESGGLHLMLFRPKQELRAGAKATIELHCGKQLRPVEFTVRKAP